MVIKRISGGVVLALTAAALAACGGNNENGGASASPAASSQAASASASGTASSAASASADYGDTGGLKLPLVDKPTTINWMLVGETPPNDKMIVKEIEKRTGITVNFQTYASSTFQDKLKVTVASGKLPDIFHGLTAAELKKLGKQGAVVAINDYANMLPNFKKLYMEENDWVVKSYGDESGKIYTWPIYDMNRAVNHGFLYRKDIFQKNGIPEWTDTEGFYQALKKLKEIYPDSYPYASKSTVNIFKDFAYGWGIGGANYPVYYDEAAKTWKFASTQPESKAMLDFMKKLYNEKLLDPEFITDTQDSWTSKMTSGKSFVTFDWIGRLDLFYNQVKDSNPKYDLRYGNPVGPTGHVRSLPKIEAGWSITVANNANKEASLKLLDYLTSPSGAALMTLGVEGETFNFDANGKPVYPELANEPAVDIKVLENKYGIWLEGAYLRPDHRSVYFNYTEKEQEAQDKITSGNKFEPLDPVLNFTDDETATIAELQTSLQKAAEEFNTRYVLDKKYGDAEWEAWKTNADKLGAAKLAKIFNDAQQRYDSAK
ncbi:extracellular solute-binding protein [Cohnella ginsengisoli]|uniref:Extracellular solute-binding protein n=1 Tax=Cohnella ginsengisoli TaxID=425004 RepID=A0A9X4KQ62_9BACL|nr:extracellular solute-binding protein [Cohnella ginsengisoli]MDG0794177.1 extracellular solute-binding protein [Cohnella ginsengisoli]